jgi:hypothetical protein
MESLPSLEAALSAISQDGRLSEESWKRLDKELTQVALRAVAGLMRPLGRPGRYDGNRPQS